ncbi:hypothetical protein OSH08_16605 [Kaistia geumhonensis]|uniref:Outer membrane protein beta-barrel domain-containing protein n=1 Tax=Kaistia geumhonensis TaxID=410839 RepID=A0ABU0M9L8_9HYPH|nr:hypothetical protein [Kaistia geumhonensis]MCX5480625.1 hypothetical protein [Kaistia geumhonensis]MDQ0517672.1 hypothetical protein [Kaistia geumhonensis]
MRMRIAIPALAGTMAAGLSGLTAATAADLTITPPAPVEAAAPAQLMPNEAFFGGLGLGLGFLSVTDQSLYAQGVSHMYEGGVPYAYGAAGGTTYPPSGSDTTLSGFAQLGYYHQFQGTDWLWGAKLSYAYLGASSEADGVAVPQNGRYYGTTDGTVSGHVVVGSYETELNQQFALMPFIGRSFGRGFIYGGGGPSLSQTTTNLNNMVGLARMSGKTYDMTGPSDDFSSSDWVWGASLTLGGTYFLTRDWFIDASYAVNFTEGASGDFSAPFVRNAYGWQETGILSGDFSNTITTQTLSISINRAF